jgi:hypothetical protein
MGPNGVRGGKMRDIKKEALSALQFMIDGIKDGKTIVIDVNSSRTAVEKPVHEFSGPYKEFEPSREYRVEFTLANREEFTIGQIYSFGVGDDNVPVRGRYIGKSRLGGPEFEQCKESD